MHQTVTPLTSYRDPLLNGNGVAAAGTDAASSLGGMVRTVLGYWRTLAVGVLVSAGIALAVGHKFARRTWQAEGTLLFSPFPVPDNLRGEYNPPSSQTLIQLVKSPQNIERLRQEFGLEMLPKTFDKLINVTQPTNAELVTVTLDWAEPDTASAMVNRLMELHIQHVAQLRKTKVAESMKSLESSLEQARQRLSQRRKAHDDFEAKARVQNISLELDRLQREAATQEQNLAIPRNTLRTLLNQQARLNELLDEQNAGSAGTDQLEGANTDQTYQFRQTALRDLIQTAEFRLAESTKEYESKLHNYNALRNQARLGISSKYELEQAKADVELARTKRNNNQAAIDQHKKEMQSLPVRYAEGRKAALAEQIKSAKADIASVEKMVAEKRNEAREMSRLLSQAEPFTKAVKESEDEVAQITTQMIALERLSMHRTNEFVMESPGVCVAYPTSTRKKLTLASFGLPMLLVVGGILLYDRRAAVADRIRKLRQA